LFFRRYLEGISKGPIFLHRRETGETFRLLRVFNHIGKRDCPLVKPSEEFRCPAAIAVHRQERNLKEILPARLPEPELNVPGRFWYWASEASVYKYTKVLKGQMEVRMSLEKCLSFRRFTELESKINGPLPAACGPNAPKQE
jgi:hypothetical protein